MTRLVRSRGAVAARTLMAAVVMLQVAVPAAALWADGGPHRFGWHMYSYPGDVPAEAKIATHHGVERLHLGDVAHLRRESTPADFAVAICARMPEAVTVTFQPTAPSSFDCHDLPAR